MVAHNKLVINGSFAGGDEVWSIGINFMGRTGSADLITDQTGLNNWAAAVHANIGDDLTLVKNGLTQNGGFDNTIAQYFNASNELALQSTPAANYIPGLGTNYGPLQVAITVSLQTGIPGASYRGRFYLPAPGAGIDANFRLASPTAPADLAEQVGEWLQLVNDYSGEGGGDLVPCVFSPTRDLVTAVTAVRVGNVADTQRRRRDSLSETYSTYTL